MTTKLWGSNNLQVIRDAFLSGGYAPNAIVADYDFAVPNGHTTLDSIDLVAFSDPFRHDLHTSCIAAQQVDQGVQVQQLLSKLSYLAVPLALVARNDSVELWPVRPTTKAVPQQPIERLSYDQLTPFFAQHKEELQPHAVVTAKTKGVQFSFFDLDPTLLEFAYEATRGILVKHFKAAVFEGQESLMQRGVGEDQAKSAVTRVALQLLAASILEDKRLLTASRSQSATQLLERAANNYKRYFDASVLTQVGDQVADAMWQLLRHNITFRSFTNEMLGYFYEHAFIDDRVRRDLKIYYTPSSIARRILERLPIEDIHPSKRVVFDGACGSGNLLVAGYERLAGLLPANWDSTQIHRYLVERIRGVDLQPFAAQVAGLSLFFMDLPSGDSWDVVSADFLTTQRAQFSPTILVGNPPFKEQRSVGGKRQQEATAFLDGYLNMLPPGGLLGMVLPETFIENSSCRATRNRLLTECDLLEMWHLPEGIFPMSNAATVVVLARKQDANNSLFKAPVRVERVHSPRKEQERFLNQGEPGLSYIVHSSKEWLQNDEIKITSSPLDRHLWVHVQSHKTLKDVADVKNGINVDPAHPEDIQLLEDLRRQVGIDRISPQWRPWLSGPGSFEPYLLRPKTTKFVDYPGHLERPRPGLERIFATPNAKVLVDSGRAPGNPWRMYAAIDDFGYFPSKAIYCVIPRSREVTLYELVATLNSPIASAWIDSRNRRRWIGSKVLEGLPFPELTSEQREALAKNVKELMRLKRLATASPSEDLSSNIRNLVEAVDSIIYEAFALPDSARRALVKYMQGFPRPGREWAQFTGRIDATAARHSGRTWSVTGQVITVDPDTERLTLWIRGYNNDQPFETPISASMPGWAMRAEAAFRAVLPWEHRYSQEFPVSELTMFRPVEFSYLSSEELAGIIAHKDEETLNQIYGFGNGNNR